MSCVLLTHSSREVIGAPRQQGSGCDDRENAEHVCTSEGQTERERIITQLISTAATAVI